MAKNFLLSLLVVFLLFGCTKKQTSRKLGFYYWKTALQITPFLANYLEQTHADRLFIKFADIARNPTTGEIEPYALLVADTAGLAVKDIVPCFFITNSVFQHTDESTLGWLSERLLESLESVGAQWGKTPQQWPEIQLDCDWTATTKTAYFSFLKKVKMRLPNTILNVTIRLHQYDNPTQTGIPPVQRGTLMCYNTGNIEDKNAQNSIFDLADATKYRSDAAYPLPLDLALPIFSWALVYRADELWRIIPECQATTFSDTTKFIKNTHLFEVKNACFVGGHLLRPKDEIRVETCTPELLESGKSYWNTIKLASNATVLFYHLDSLAAVRFSVEELGRIKL
jgi:hypothetical protein